jgi:hypothetical protein
MNSNNFPTLVGILVCLMVLALFAYRRYASQGVQSFPRVDENAEDNYGVASEYQLYTQCEDPMGEFRERIIGVAIKHASNNLVYWAVPPLRHHNIINNYLAPRQLAGSVQVNSKHQGFVTSHGRFVDRREALCIAERAKQIVEKTEPAHKLFSEDMW